MSQRPWSSVLSDFLLAYSSPATPRPFIPRQIHNSCLYEAFHVTGSSKFYLTIVALHISSHYVELTIRFFFYARFRLQTGLPCNIIYHVINTIMLFQSSRGLHPIILYLSRTNYSVVVTRRSGLVDRICLRCLGSRVHIPISFSLVLYANLFKHLWCNYSFFVKKSMSLFLKSLSSFSPCYYYLSVLSNIGYIVMTVCTN